MEWMTEYLEKTRELARRLTEWSMRSRLSRTASLSGVSRLKHSLVDLDQSTTAQKSRAYKPHASDMDFECDHNAQGSLYVCTGGAGGFMEARSSYSAFQPLRSILTPHDPTRRPTAAPLTRAAARSGWASRSRSSRASTLT